ncbi:MAG: signal peptide peptidase SppA [Pseudomonadota bacterium]
MNDQAPSVAGRFFRGLWRVVNGTRLVILNLVFFFFLFLVVLAFMTPKDTVVVESQTTLVLQPQGNIVEEYTTTVFDRALQDAMEQGRSETRLRDLVKAIERGADDTRIVQLLIDTDGMWGIGLASLLELEEAINGFKSRGKNVVALGTNMSQHQYYLAALADEVWLAPDGMVWIDGYANVRNFFAEGLDKLSVRINLFRVGEFKSAMEPFIRSDMSPEAREASLHWLNSLWQTYTDGVTRLRGIPPQALGSALGEMPARIEAAGGSFARFALEEGLVDRLVTKPEARQALALSGAGNRSGDGFRAVSHDDYLSLFKLPAALKPRHDVKILVAEGQIVAGQQGPGTISAETTSRQLRALGRDDSVRAVVLRINSPGGDAQASEQIRQELSALQDAGKTVVVSMGDVAASGGYWIAMSADEIWASPSTITGSIGVFGFLPTIDETMGRMGIYADGVGTTELAGKLRIDRPLDPQVGRMLQASTERVYADFISKVAEHRSQSESAIDEVARGRVWSGEQAQDHGLVDQLGGLDEAVDAAARMAGLGANYSAGYFQPTLSPLESFFAEMSGSAMAMLPVSGDLPMLPQRGFLADLLSDLQAISAADGRFTVAAHCLCEVR